MDRLWDNGPKGTNSTHCPPQSDKRFFLKMLCSCCIVPFYCYFTAEIISIILCLYVRVFSLSLQFWVFLLLVWVCATFTSLCISLWYFNWPPDKKTETLTCGSIHALSLWLCVYCVGVSPAADVLLLVFFLRRFWSCSCCLVLLHYPHTSCLHCNTHKKEHKKNTLIITK